MSFFDRLDHLKERQIAKPEEKAQAIPMPKLSFAEIVALQQQEKQEPVKRKPGRPPKVKT